MDRDEIVDAVMQPIADAEVRSATGDGWWLTVVGWQGRARQETSRQHEFRKTTPSGSKWRVPAAPITGPLKSPAPGG
jgi:hypothetical protein